MNLPPGKHKWISVHTLRQDLKSCVLRAPLHQCCFAHIWTGRDSWHLVFQVSRTREIPTVTELAKAEAVNGGAKARKQHLNVPECVDSEGFTEGVKPS